MRKVVFLVTVATLLGLVSCLLEPASDAEERSALDEFQRCQQLERDGQQAASFECYDGFYAGQNPSVPEDDRQQLVRDMLQCIRDHNGANVYGDGERCDTELSRAVYPDSPISLTQEAIVLTQEAVHILASVEAYETNVAAEEASPPQDEGTPPSPVEAAADLPDICSLLPVVRNLIIDESDFGDWATCTADIDSIVGCNGCGSLMSITRLPTAEQAFNSLTIPADCGLAMVGSQDLLQTQALPFGGLGYACPDSEEPYREGVAERYFSLWFTLDRYSVTVGSRFPGQETVILGLGQEIAGRIQAAHPGGSPVAP